MSVDENLLEFNCSITEAAFDYISTIKKSVHLYKITGYYVQVYYFGLGLYLHIVPNKVACPAAFSRSKKTIIHPSKTNTPKS